MRAASYRAFGPATEVFEFGDLPTPVPEAGQVLVRLHASGINPLDVKFRAGDRGPLGGDVCIPHYDGAGVIEAVGEGVDAARVGERVWVIEGRIGRAWGTAAEYIAIESWRAVPLGEKLSFEEGACLGIPAVTAWLSIGAGGDVAGKNVLVTGGAGAVGSYAIQFAKAQCARVIANVSSDEKAAQARGDGADETVNYREGDTAAAILELTGGKGVDHISEVELGGNMKVTAKILRPGASVAAYASMAEPEATIPFYRFLRTGPSFHIVACFVPPRAEREATAAAIGRIVVERGLTTHIAGTWPLAEIAAAHEAVESGTLRGNAVGTIG
ncbi:MAG: NADPH:quinone reductase [Alphaproteobacteria bacterium]